MTNETTKHDIPLDGVQIKHVEREIQLRLDHSDLLQLVDPHMEQLMKSVRDARAAGRDGLYYRLFLSAPEYRLAKYIMEARYQRLRRTHGENTQRSGYALATAQAETTLRQFTR